MEQRRLSTKVIKKRRSKLRVRQKSTSLEPFFQSNPNSEGLSMVYEKQKAKNEILGILSKNLIKDKEQKQKQKFSKLKYQIPVQQQFASRQQGSNGQRFLNKELVNKFILLIFMMIVMVLLGVVTPNTIFANRRPEERYAINNKNKNLQVETNLRQKINEMTNMQFLNQMNGNHENHIKIHHPLIQIPEQTKIGLKSVQNNILFRPNIRNFDQKHQLFSFNDQYSFKKPVSQIFGDFEKQNKVESSSDNNLNIQQPKSTDLRVKLMQVTHNVDYRGRVFLDQKSLLKQELSVENLLEKHKRIRQLLQEQKKVYEKKYQISAYLNQQIKFCIIVILNEEFYENKFYFRVLDSIFQQEYQNYHVVLIDDSMSESYFNKSVRYMIDNKIPTQKYTLIKNLQPKGTVHNIFMVVDKYCYQGQVVIPMNTGQALIGRQSLALLNSLYQKYQSVVVIPSFISIKQNQSIDIGINLTNPSNNPQNQSLRNKKDICNFYPITFYAQLFKKIDPQDFIQNEHIQFYQQTCAYTLPILQMALQNTLYVPQLAFQFRQSAQNQKRRQKQISEILQKTPYKKIPAINFQKNKNKPEVN